MCGPPTTTTTVCPEVGRAASGAIRHECFRLQCSNRHRWRYASSSCGIPTQCRYPCWRAPSSGNQRHTRHRPDGSHCSFHFNGGSKGTGTPVLRTEHSDSAGPITRCSPTRPNGDVRDRGPRPCRSSDIRWSSQRGSSKRFVDAPTVEATTTPPATNIARSAAISTLDSIVQNFIRSRRSRQC